MMVNTEPVRSVRLAAVMVPYNASMKPRADGQFEAGSGAAAVSPACAVEFVEHVLQISGAVCLVPHRSPAGRPGRSVATR